MGCHKRGNYEDVILISNDINRLLENFENGRLQIIGILDVDFVKIKMGWILAYTYFNLQNYEQMEKCIYWDGVIDAHPGGKKTFMMHVDDANRVDILHRKIRQIVEKNSKENADSNAGVSTS